MFGAYSYLVYLLVFTFAAIGLFWAYDYRFLRRNIRIVAAMAAFGVLYQLVTDPFAEHWGAWFFSEDKILGFWIYNFPVENVLFFFLVSIAISSAVLVFIHRQG
ncbi:lycopene cyclase domain-containing protein [Candidatus Parcubacteria bacterium]|nr:MAG: lycopene cyclase domain-containing protein [Candidatus Parcubacteria bacterium]